MSSLAAALAAGLLACLPAGVRARVSIAPRQIVVITATARAVITRSPLRLGVCRCPGRTVLGEVADTRPAPALESATIDPAPPGFDNPSGRPPYAPLRFTNAAAVRYRQREVARAFDLGADGFMQDFGEEVLFDMHFADGESGVTMHNRYLTLYAKATREEIRRTSAATQPPSCGASTAPATRACPEARPMTEGFPGDETTDCTRSSGLASLTPDMLSRAVNRADGYGSDIGGYYDLTTPPTPKDLLLRWAEWAALSPIFRLHWSGRAGTHTPWSYDAQTVRV